MDESVSMFLTPDQILANLPNDTERLWLVWRWFQVAVQENIKLSRVLLDLRQQQSGREDW